MKDSLKSKKAFDLFSEYLRQQGLNSTQQRDTIVQLFLNSIGHMSAEELYQQAKTFDENIGITTVYRTLKLLQDAGLAFEHKFYGSTSKYEYMDSDDQHDHMICDVCGKVTEFQIDELKSILEKNAKNLGFDLMTHKLELFGRCSSHQNKYPQIQTENPY